jgi:N-dimethylarginine dimethylaminohydrolase
MSKQTIVHNATGKLKRVLIGKPTYNKILPLSDVARDQADIGTEFSRELQYKQHTEFEDCFRQLGVEINWVKLDPELPWGMFTRDFGVNTSAGALIGKFRYSERWGEEIRARETLEELGETIIPKHVTKGCVEGGDSYMLAEDILVIGNGNRSTYAGFENAREIMKNYGVRVYVVEFLSKWNHLDIIFQPVADKLAIVCEDAVPAYFIGFLDALGWELIKVPGEHARKTEINMLAVGDGKVISFKGNRLNERLRAHGLTVYDPDFSVIAAGGGGPHCYSFELEREP